MYYRNNLLLIIVFILLTNCASTIQSTGNFSSIERFHTIEIQCITPTRLYKFSNNLCNYLKSSLENSDLSVYVKVKDEITPSLERSDNIDSRKDVLILEITHERINLYNGKPTSTLMNISARLAPNKELIWAAKIHTSGNSLTGPGNPEKVSMEIISQMKKDGFDF